MSLWWYVLGAHGIVAVIAAVLDCTASLAVLGLSALHTASAALDDADDARESGCLH